MPVATLPFFKMNGIGNAILVVDARAAADAVTRDQVRAAARRPGLAFDQMMVIEKRRTEDTDAFVTIFNADGSEAGACGNGTRCVAWVLTQDASKPTLMVETAAGRLACERLGAQRFSVDMGRPLFDWRAVPLAEPVTDTDRLRLPILPDVVLPEGDCAVLSMGNPHAVFFVEDVASVPLAMLGPAVEHHPMFPERANVSFAEVRTRAAVHLRVWERSAGATLACGSAACATAVAGMRRRLIDRHVEVTLPGGTLELSWRESDEHVIMTGDVALEHAGHLTMHGDGLLA